MTDQADDEKFPPTDIPPQRKPVDLRPQQKKITRVTTGVVVKKQKPLLDRLAQVFWGGDADTVGKYVIYDVLLPAAKDTLFDMINAGAAMILFGQTTNKPLLGRGTNRDRNQVSYASFYQGGRNNTRARTEAAPRRRNSRYEFEQVVMPNRRAAEAVLTKLLEAIDAYDVATVSDFYEAAGVPTEFTDNSYGWSNLSQARIVPTRDGYLIELPRPLPVE